MLTFAKSSTSVLRTASVPRIALRNILATRGLAMVTDRPIPMVAGTPPAVPTAQLNSSENLPASLKLKSGQIITGTSFGAPKSVFGEAVFTTSLVGYNESMTDPSYRGQILVFTQPLIGNYGVPSTERDMYGLLKHFESDRIQVQGIIVNDYATRYSHWNAVESLAEWCSRHGVPAISGVDTRAVTHLLREQGSTLAKIAVGEEALDGNLDYHFVDPNLRNLVAEVSTKANVHYNDEGDVKIAVIDCGVKQNIIRCLAERGAAVTVLPWDVEFSHVADQYDGLFISNGPGNPMMCEKIVRNLKVTLDTYQRPIFGICMGNLLLGMAAGLRPYKLPYGNRGHNQPAINQMDGRCVITSQNHGYALGDSIMPAGWSKFFVNANDRSNEGIRHVSRPICSVQFHPEAKGGPQDTEYLFAHFLNQVRAGKAKRQGTSIFTGQEVQQEVQQEAAVAFA
jgi:carbamoyl-phosphate synthase small subunit